MKFKVILSVLVGHALERYDVFLWGILGWMLTPLFFPDHGLWPKLSNALTFLLV